ncbi:hypothetical protein [Mycolicibacterium sp. XJ870]
MNAALRPYTTSGIALVGAVAIAVSPVLVAPPPLPDIQVANPAIELTQIQNPIEVWALVLETAVENLGALAGDVLADPAPVLTQVIINQLTNAGILAEQAVAIAGAVLNTLGNLPDTFEAALGALLEGNVVEAVGILTATLIPLGLAAIAAVGEVGEIISRTVQNFANAVAVLTSGDTILSLALGFAGPVLSPLNALTETVQRVVTAIGALDVEELLDAVINAPAVLTDAVLNGHGTLFGIITLPGLLTPGPGTALNPAGPIGALLDLRRAIADAITPAPAPLTLAATQQADLPDPVVVIGNVIGDAIRLGEGFVGSGLRFGTGVVGLPVSLIATGVALIEGDREQLAFLAGQFIDAPLWVADPTIFALRDVLPEPLGGASGLVMQFRNTVLIPNRDNLRNFVQGVILGPQEAEAETTLSDLGPSNGAATLARVTSPEANQLPSGKRLVAVKTPPAEVAQEDGAVDTQDPVDTPVVETKDGNKVSPQSGRSLGSQRGDGPVGKAVEKSVDNLRKLGKKLTGADRDSSPKASSKAGDGKSGSDNDGGNDNE